METTVRNNTEQSRYELMVEDAVAGVVEYRDHGDRVELTHTEVDPSYEGEGLGSHLAHAVLDNLRNEERSLIPSCRFISGYLKRHPEFAELVPADRRPEYGL
ncbi:MAG: N-acetyltransferase [Actinomycetota bacterium]|nr:N-acetyltransferase [Actinomycetota bacterium]